MIPSTDVKFISEGNELANIKYATGRAYGKLFVPEKRIGFEFNGWYSDEYLTSRLQKQILFLIRLQRFMHNGIFAPYRQIMLVEQYRQILYGKPGIFML